MAFGPHFYLSEIMRIKGRLLASGPHASEATDGWVFPPGRST
jgi:hypothetical protein